jgi:hypothetical protein
MIIPVWRAGSIQVISGTVYGTSSFTNGLADISLVKANLTATSITVQTGGSEYISEPLQLDTLVKLGFGCVLTATQDLVVVGRSGGKPVDGQAGGTCASRLPLSPAHT